MKIEEKLNQGWLHCFIIIEIAGKPANYVTKVFDGVLKNLAKEKGIEIVKKKVHKAKKIEIEKNAVFSTFAEIEMLVMNMKKLIDITFDYMPSSVEIVAPLTLKLELNDVNGLINDLAARLHRYEQISKQLSFENEILKNQLAEAGKQ